MKVLIPDGPLTTDTRNRPRTVPLGDAAFHFLAVVAAVQGAHMVEHVVQLLQVTVFGVPDDDALGLLGYVVQFNGTEEWLHLGYNAVFVVALWALVLPLWRVLPRRAFWTDLRGRVRLGRDVAHRRTRRDHLPRHRQWRLSLPRDRRRRALNQRHGAALRLQRRRDHRACRHVRACPPRP